MALINRYTRAPILAGGTRYGTSYSINTIKRAIDNEQLKYKVITLQGSERLDIIAGREYNDSSVWWIIAAASGIGWALQVAPGTRIVIPTDLSQVADLVG